MHFAIIKAVHGSRLGQSGYGLTSFPVVTYINIPNHKSILSKRTLKLSNKAVIESTSLKDIHTFSTGACMWSFSVFMSC